MDVPYYILDPGTGIAISPEQSAAKRIRNGECPTCANTLFEVKRSRFNPLKVSKKPLTIPGKVFEGRCLECNPLNDGKCRSEVVGRISGTKKKVRNPSGIDTNDSDKDHECKVPDDSSMASAANVDKTDAEIKAQAKAFLNRGHIRHASERVTNIENEERENRNHTRVKSEPSEVLRSISGSFEDNSVEISQLERQSSAEERVARKLEEIGVSPFPKGQLLQYDAPCATARQNGSGRTILSTSTSSNASLESEVVYTDVHEVISAMLSGPSCVLTGRKLVKRLLELARTEETAIIEIIMGGGMNALRKVMTGGLSMDEPIQEYSMETLQLLLPITDERIISVTFPEETLVETVTAIMMNFSESLAIQKNVFRILKNLSHRNHKYKAAIAKCGVIDICFAMMVKFSSETLNMNGYALLHELSAYM